MVTRGIVFDLDDTLYLERDYVRSGFDHVARRIAESAGESREIADWLWSAFEVGVRGDTFDRLLACHPGLAERVTAAALIDAYRGHDPAIALLSGASDLLKVLGDAGFRLGVLSGGPLASQSAKARTLGLQRWFDPILLTASRESDFQKPATRGFEWIATEWRLPHAELAYIADNPSKDFLGPRRLGWRTVRVRMPEQLTFALDPPDDDHRPDAEVADLGAAIGQLTS
jgi:putative hydrolase of the HAD superfamily